MPPEPHVPALLVVGLCAQWCGTCRDWRAVFDAQAAARPALRFRWLDIEDEAGLAGELDVEDFPTLLLMRGPTVLFFGPLLPQPGHLRQLIERAEAAGLAEVDPARVPGLAALVEAMLAEAPAGGGRGADGGKH